MADLARLVSVAGLGVALTACGGDDLHWPHDAGVDAATGDAAPTSDAGSDASAGDAGTIQPCSGEGLSLCTAGRCTLSGNSAALPAGAVATVAEIALDPALTTDALFPYECQVGLPDGVDAGSVALQLQMAVPAGIALPASGATLFQWSPPDAVRLASQATISGGAIAGTITAGGSFGVAASPAAASLSTLVGTDPRSSADLPSLLRNISGGTMSAAFYDGTRLYLGSGGRVLVFDGIPADPSVKPDVVLGQQSLDSSLVGTTAALFDLGVTAIWSNGQKLVVGTGRRVLVWNQVPTVSFTPADLVLGQPDFSSDVQNNGGVSASTLANPWGIDSDGTRLAVADLSNNRVLVWSAFPTALDQPATSVIGQASFAMNGIETGQLPIYQAYDVALDGTGAFVASGYTGVLHTAEATTTNATEDYAALNWRGAVQPDGICLTTGVAFTASGGLAAGDSCAERLGIWRSKPTTTTPMDFALGQPDTHVDNAQPVSASSLASTLPGARAAGGKLLVHDLARVLLWDPEPTYAFEPAARVFGQPGFTTDDVGIDYRNISASTLAYPAAVASRGGMVAVADRGNNRVLLYSNSLTTGAAATVVLGQPDFGSFIPDLDQVTPSAARMSGPAGVALDGQHLIVADTENHRVLIWNQVPTASATPADLVLGQSDFSGRRPNAGRGDADLDGHSDAAADGFFAPTGVASDGTHLFVGDRINNRILVWSTFPTTSGTPADKVIGQKDMQSVLANGGAGPDGVAALSFQLPQGIALDGTTLYVADTENNRVVRIENASTTPAGTAWFGQANGTSVSVPNFYPQTSPNAGYPLAPATAASTVLRPSSVVVAGGELLVSETTSNRVHVFDATSFGSLGFLGQTSPTSAAANAGGIGATSVSAPAGLAADATHLYLADSANHRVLSWPLASVAPLTASGVAASAVLGQPTFANTELDGSVVASAGGTTRPRGLAVDGGELFYTEADYNRVLVTAAPPTAGSGSSRLYGEPNAGLLLPNAGGAPSASTLASPRGVFADSAHVVIADTGNNRVLVYDRPSGSTTASLVLGQTDFTGASANGGGPAGAATLSGPEGVYSDGARFFVADTGNHRVLVWDAFPTSTGQPADHVLGQADFSSVLPDRGGAPTASTLSSPTAVRNVGGALYIADSGNNRVLRFAAFPTANGAGADDALGQPDLASRTPGSAASDPTRLAGPVQLADDGIYLYICDRDLNRIVSYPLTRDTAALLAIPPGVVTFSGPDGLAAERTASFGTRLYIGDTGDARVAVVDGLSRLESP